MRKAISVAVLSLLVGCGAEPDQGGAQTETRAGALHPSGFGTWSVIPGANTFNRRPSLETDYTSASNRDWNVCGTTSANTILCNYRNITSGRDSGWAGWTAVTPPSGFTFGASNPTTASWNDNLGNLWSALAARVNGSGCQNCIYIQIQRHGVSNTWYQVPQSGVLDQYANLDDISLVANDGSLYLFGIGGGSAPYIGYYAQNYVFNGYSNSWTWANLPGGGLFNKPVLATPLSNPGGGLIVVGIGTDNAAWGQQMFDGNWDGYWWQVGGAFKDAVGCSSFAASGSDLEVFGLGSDGYSWQGNLYNWNSFDGWYTIANQNSYLTSPVAFLPPGTSHIDLAALQNTHQIAINEFNGGPNP